MAAVSERETTVWQDKVQSRALVAGDGPPLVFFHGAMGLTWDPFLDALAESFTVYAPEHPGTTPGLPDSIKPIDNLWDLVLSYYEVFDELGLESPAVVGHSFGGMVAAEVAATNPSRVSRLALIDPVGLWRDDTPVKNWMATAPQDLGPLLFADPTGPAAQMMATPPPDPETGIQMALRTTWSLACTGKFVWPIPDKGLKKRLHRITAPTLILWGEQDGLVPAVYASEFEHAIPDARVELIAGAGHVPQMEQLEQTATAVKGFLGG